jgi:O-antigen ligase
MTELPIDIHAEGKKERSMIERLMLASFLFIITTRLVITEGLNIQAIDQIANITNTAYSLFISSVILAASFIWFMWRLSSKKFSYRVTDIEPGFFLFIIACAIGFAYASDKRAAITHSVTYLIPIVMAFVLVQMLDSDRKIRTLLYVVAFLGAVTTLYCLTQYFWINSMMISQYKDNPAAILSELGIKPTTYQHMLFEQSLRSRDVRGFFTTGNSVGSFLILSVFSTIALMLQRKNESHSWKKYLDKFCPIILLLISLAGLIVTRSKGAIGAMILATVMIGIYMFFGRWIRTHKKAVLSIAFLLIVLVCVSITIYGLGHQRLPGGNSMLVRWQYWYSSIKMFADHPLTGVGPGNYGVFYPQYKIPAAIETVADPHNFLLTILTQYGPIGLIAFILAIYKPLNKTFFSKETTHVSGMLFIGITAFLIHNCVDFAIFEPAVYTVFWTMIAAAVAISQTKTAPKTIDIKLGITKRLVMFIPVVLTGVVFVQYSLMPVAKSTSRIRQAKQYQFQSRFGRAHRVLEEAAVDDALSPAAASLNGKLYLQHFRMDMRQDPLFLTEAKKHFDQAIYRDPSNFKNFERLSEVYVMLSEVSTKQSSMWLANALDASLGAVDRYPGSGRIHLGLAEIADLLGRGELSLKHYKKAVEIEDAYREQFKIMYPGREIFSRLGEEVYQNAIRQIESLSGNP